MLMPASLSLFKGHFGCNDRRQSKLAKHSKMSEEDTGSCSEHEIGGQAEDARGSKRRRSHSHDSGEFHWVPPLGSKTDQKRPVCMCTVVVVHIGRLY